MAMRPGIVIESFFQGSVHALVDCLLNAEDFSTDELKAMRGDIARLLKPRQRNAD